MIATDRVAWFVALAIALAVVAAAAPAIDRVTDRDTYEAAATRGIVRDCSDIHCFRVLVPWTVGLLPGPSLVRWKLYAAAANAGAAIVVFDLALLLGLSHRAATFASIASAFGFGSMYTLFDPYTADPLMYLLGPLLTNELLRGRVVLAALIGSAGTLAKEFAAAPLYMFSAFAAIRGEWLRSLRALAAANAALIVWLSLQLTLILAFNYGYGGNPSTDLLGGGYLRPWLAKLSARGALSAMLNEYTAFYVLAPIGLWFADRRLRQLALVAVPIAAVFAYVQQPDRALWNFHFLVVPLGAVVLERVSPSLAWATLALFAATNLKVAAQWDFVPPARYIMPLTMLSAFACGIAAFFTRGVADPHTLHRVSEA
jgi:hypothetical protein